ncbi:MAG TPA: metallophosphoesterase family protein [Chthoniobacterales bacterium]|nr:metallophosphoesterase family protein [Chthoniobacterales bacterium]
MTKQDASPARTEVIAAIYDIHGNLPALDAVLTEIQNSSVDRIIVGGDVVPGPMPRETLHRLLQCEIPIDFIHGNGEVAVLQQLSGQRPTAIPEQVWPLIEWTANQLEPEDHNVLRVWPKTLAVATKSLGKILFCHATPQSETEIFTRLSSDDRLRAILSGVDADIVVCGHTHMQFDRRVDNVRVINAGSVGMPFGKPGAYWLLLGSDVRLRCTDYDREKAAAKIRACDYPQAEQFADTNILNPPSEEQMLEVFSKSAA